MEHIGLQQVRDHRLGKLNREEDEWCEQMEHRAKVIPEMAPLLLIYMGGMNAIR